MKTTEQLASEAGFEVTPNGIFSSDDNPSVPLTPQLERFAALVAGRERERYAGIEEYLVAAADSSMSRNNSENLAAELLAQIRGERIIASSDPPA
jgi:hypothetical protein